MHLAPWPTASECSTRALDWNRAKVEKIAACVLHNMPREEVGFTSNLCDQEDPATHSVTNGSWREDPLLGKATLAISKMTAPTGDSTANEVARCSNALMRKRMCMLKAVCIFFKYSPKRHAKLKRNTHVRSPESSRSELINLCKT